jgi:hypothetical protein
VTAVQGVRSLVGAFKGPKRSPSITCVHRERLSGAVHHLLLLDLSPSRWDPVFLGFSLVLKKVGEAFLKLTRGEELIACMLKSNRK